MDQARLVAAAASHLGVKRMAAATHFTGMERMKRMSRIDHILAIIDDVLRSAEIVCTPRAQQGSQRATAAAVHTNTARR
jgi:hypothetical protein